MRTAIAAMIVLLFEVKHLEAKSGEDGRDVTVWGKYELVDPTHNRWGGVYCIQLTPDDYYNMQSGTGSRWRVGYEECQVEGGYEPG